MRYTKRGETGRAWGADLYIMALPELNAVKIGRAWNTTRRAHQLSLGCAPLNPTLVATFTDKGHLERLCHRALAQHRITERSEWFRLPVVAALEAVCSIISAAEAVEVESRIVKMLRELES
jgi:hypothetical protein